MASVRLTPHDDKVLKFFNDPRIEMAAGKETVVSN